MKKGLFLIVLLAVFSVAFLGCGPKAFTKGDYDDPEKINLLDDKFNEADMQQIADVMVKSLLAHPAIANARKTPVLQVETLKNKTDEHIDTKAITDMIRTNLIKSGKVLFVSKEARETLAEEYDYNNSGYVRNDTAKKKGGQIAADFILFGEITSNVQQVGDQKLIYYKVNLNLSDITENIIKWSDEKQIRKKYNKQSVGL